MRNTEQSETTTQQEESKAIAELVLFLMDNHEEVTKALKNVHDLALYFTTEPLHPEDRTDLFYTNKLLEFIKEVPH